jgi:pimeloyl-ACP methyl ester carboxylesterase
MPGAGDAHSYTASWCPGGAIGYVEAASGGRVRYLTAGEGPPLVLLHTVRTQLDHFQLVIPQLTGRYTVYALDFPGMGWSDIAAGARYQEPDLRAAVVSVIDHLGLTGITLAGESMGATIALTAAAELADRVRRVVAVNSYDYPGGIQRANAIAWLAAGGARQPVPGTLVARLENKPILGAIMRGGLHDPGSLPRPYLDELRRVGRRPGYPRVATAIFRNLDSLIASRERYRSVTASVTLVYGDGDWSRPSDRAANQALFPGAPHITLKQTGHFASLDQPGQIAQILLDG